MNRMMHIIAAGIVLSVAFSLVFGIAPMMPANAADITWGEAQNITGDSDVCTNGVLRYAYANTNATVNGVKFSAGMTTTYFPGGEEGVADITLGNVNRCYLNTGYYATANPDGACEDYLQLLKGAVYNTASVGGSVTSTFTLNNLVAGHEYIVQLWTHDQRSNPGDYRYIKVDDLVELKLRASTGFGQYIIGSFTANVETQSFSVVGYTNESTQKGVSQINSIQLRDVTEGCITWEEPKDIVADTDMRLDGEPVFAAGWMAATAIVNNVVFVPLTATNSTTVYPDVKMTIDGMSNYRTAEFNKDIGQALSDDYHRLLGGATYKSSDIVATVTMEGLVQGGRYLVQLWINDSRTTTGPYRHAAIDGGSHVLYKNTANDYGQHITGLFTASSTSQDFTIHPMSTSGSCSPQLNAIQLRRLDAGATTHWRVSPITKRALDVRTDGDLLYACNFAGSCVTTEVNGVEFVGIPRKIWRTAGGNDDFGFATPSYGYGHDTAFNFTDSDTPSEYITMLKSALYSAGGSHDATPSTLTLKQLTPGRRYLVQIWVSEPRTSDPLPNRYQTLDGEATMEFSDEASGITPVRGDVATGLFTATATNQAISIQSGHWTDEASRSVQINGMQVRDLGEAQGLSILVEDVPMWHVASGATTDLDGATRSLGTVSGSGAITNGTVSGALVVADGSAITLKDVTLSSGITLNGASSVTFAEDVDLSGMAITIADPASQAEKGTPVIMSTGTLSGTPEFSFARGGYEAKLTDDGYIVKKILGLIVIVR